MLENNLSIFRNMSKTGWRLQLDLLTSRVNTLIYFLGLEPVSEWILIWKSGRYFFGQKGGGPWPAHQKHESAVQWKKSGWWKRLKSVNFTPMIMKPFTIAIARQLAKVESVPAHVWSHRRFVDRGYDPKTIAYPGNRDWIFSITDRNCRNKCY